MGSETIRYKQHVCLFRNFIFQMQMKDSLPNSHYPLYTNVNSILSQPFKGNFQARKTTPQSSISTIVKPTLLTLQLQQSNDCQSSHVKHILCFCDYTVFQVTHKPFTAENIE